MLGEEFDSLRQARAALKQESAPAKGQKSYSVQALSSKSHRNIKTFVVDLEDHAADIDALKKPSDFWAASIYGHKTYALYGNIDELARKLGTYKGLQEEHPQKALKNVEVIAVPGVDADKYYREKREAVEAGWKRAREKHKLDRKRRRKQQRKIKQMASQQKKLQAEIRRLKKELQKRK